MEDQRLKPFSEIRSPLMIKICGMHLDHWICELLLFIHKNIETHGTKVTFPVIKVLFNLDLVT